MRCHRLDRPSLPHPLLRTDWQQLDLFLARSARIPARSKLRRLGSSSIRLIDINYLLMYTPWTLQYILLLVSFAFASVIRAQILRLDGKSLDALRIFLHRGDLVTLLADSDQFFANAHLALLCLLGDCHLSVHGLHSLLLALDRRRWLSRFLGYSCACY